MLSFESHAYDSLSSRWIFEPMKQQWKIVLVKILVDSAHMNTFAIFPLRHEVVSNFSFREIEKLNLFDLKPQTDANKN